MGSGREAVQSQPAGEGLRGGARGGGEGSGVPGLVVAPRTGARELQAGSCGAAGGVAAQRCGCTWARWPAQAALTPAVSFVLLAAAIGTDFGINVFRAPGAGRPGGAGPGGGRQPQPARASGSPPASGGPAGVRGRREPGGGRTCCLARTRLSSLRPAKREGPGPDRRWPGVLGAAIAPVKRCPAQAPLLRAPAPPGWNVQEGRGDEGAGRSEPRGSIPPRPPIPLP